MLKQSNLNLETLRCGTEQDPNRLLPACIAYTGISALCI